MKTTMN